MTVELIQYMLPTGRPVPTFCDDMPDDLKPKVEAILAAGLNFATEWRGHEVILWIEDRKKGIDYSTEIATNGPGENDPFKVLERMIREFDLSAPRVRQEGTER